MSVPFTVPPLMATIVFDLRRRVLVGRYARHEGRREPGGFGIHIVGERAFASDRAGRTLVAMDLAMSRRLVRSRETSNTLMSR